MAGYDFKPTLLQYPVHISLVLGKKLPLNGGLYLSKVLFPFFTLAILWCNSVLNFDFLLFPLLLSLNLLYWFADWFGQHSKEKGWRKGKRHLILLTKKKGK